MAGTASSLASVIVNPKELLGSSELPEKRLQKDQTKPVAFRSAKPVWPEGRAMEMNLFVGFRADFEVHDDSEVSLCLAGASLYRARINGHFVGWGPARGPHGFYRVDRWNITRHIRQGINTVSIEVAGYNINSYWTLNQPSFLQAEVITTDGVLASTGSTAHSFKAFILDQRVQEVQRYSFQRAFSEVYQYNSKTDSWCSTSSISSAQTVPCTIQPARNLIPRDVPYPMFSLHSPTEVIGIGTMRPATRQRTPVKNRSLTEIGPNLLGFSESQLRIIPFLELQQTETATMTKQAALYVPDQHSVLNQDQFMMLDLGRDLCGFIGLRVAVESSAALFITFDEILTDGDVDFTRLGCVNIISYTLAPGTYDLEAFEPYTMRFLKLIVLKGECRIENVYLREYAAPDTAEAEFASSDKGLNRIFSAGKATYRPNAVDLFTDCPSRERAGWLCDSYFTAEAAHVLMGTTQVERAFLDNFRLPNRFERLPAGMLPMCYPADHYDGVFIPNWALWFVLQLEQYLRRSGDRALVEALRARVLDLMNYFAEFHNESGLLEKLNGWIFIDWSRSNDYVQDVNYPTNMLYAAALQATGRLYDLPRFTRQGEKLHAEIRNQSFDGEFFVDNAERHGGRLIPTRNRTETCQYYAFFCGTVRPESHPTLWQTLIREFGPNRKVEESYPAVAQSDAFIGNLLRLELLARFGVTEEWVDECRACLLPMANRTGTLWEHMQPRGSLNHGFQSYVVANLSKNILGLSELDVARKRVKVRFAKTKLEWCEGIRPTPDGQIFLRWRRDGSRVLYEVKLPVGYAMDVEAEEPLQAIPWKSGLL